MINKPEEFNVATIFKNDNYIIPLYQRNYSWEEAQVSQLIQDVWDYACEGEETSYYIGTLVVHKREINNTISYETIDGQQRLTTLNILISVLKNELKLYVDNGYETKLQFDSRPISSQTLKILSDQVNRDKVKVNTKMEQAYLDMSKKIHELLTSKKITKEKFKDYLFSNVKLLRVEVPLDTDLNHYFEIMNNRGEQLEKHEILKAELLVYLKDDPASSSTFSMIWDACANMESYVQYGFKKPVRDSMFKKNWGSLPTDFESINEIIIKKNINKVTEWEPVTFLEIIKNDNTKKFIEHDKDAEGEEHFNSVVTFPNFLLHVLRLYTKSNIPLDDKRLIDTFKNHIKNYENEKGEFVKKFAFSLLKSKFLFDKYILKREFKGNEDRWSLKKIKISKEDKPYYVNTFDENKQPLMLLSMFHVSYPQMIYKHWLNGSLFYLYYAYDDGIDEIEYITYLESMSNAFYFDRFGKFESDYFDIIYKNDSIPKNDLIEVKNLNQGTNVQNFIFNRLDYLIWRSEEIDEIHKWGIPNISQFEFTFRSSVEHFYPQHPKQGAKLENVSSLMLDNFGNLCLISRNKNSELSNYSPIAKAEHYNNSSTIESLKQRLMMLQSNKWDTSEINSHQKEMITLLNG